MKKIHFKNEYEGGTPIPKVILWYATKTKHKGALNADYCNNLLNNQLKKFFDKYPEELYNAASLSWNGNNNITKENEEFYNKEIKIEEDK